jgi:hypothetical protein
MCTNLSWYQMSLAERTHNPPGHFIRGFLIEEFSKPARNAVLMPLGACSLGSDKVITAPPPGPSETRIPPPCAWATR